MSTEQKQSKVTDAIKAGDTVSVPVGTKYLIGIAEEVNSESLMINDFRNGQIRVPNNDKVRILVPYQKFDARECWKYDVKDQFYLNYKNELAKFIKQSGLSENGLNEIESKAIEIINKFNPEDVTQKLNEFLKQNKTLHPGVEISKDFYKAFDEFVFKYKPLNLAERLDKFFAKTELHSFENFRKNYKGSYIEILKGNLSPHLIKGESKVVNENNEQEVKTWACKIGLYRGESGSLKMKTEWRQEKLATKLYGIELTPEELKNMLEKKQSVVLERETLTGKPFKVFCRYDKDLNSFVTTQHSVKIGERMKASYSKKEEQTQTLKEEPKNVFKEKNDQVSKEVKPKAKKGRGI